MEALAKEFREQGCVFLPGILPPEAVAHCRRVFDWTQANPSSLKTQHFKDEPFFDDGFMTDAAGHKNSRPVYKELLEENPVIVETMAEIWDSENVWFYDHEVLRKKYDPEGPLRRTPFHQDTHGIPFRGMHMVTIWIPVGADPVPKECSLEMVRGSHLGPLRYDTTELILKDRESWPLASWACKLGDMVAFHPHTLHGNAPVTPEFPTREVLVLRLFGDDCFFHPHWPEEKGPRLFSKLPLPADPRMRNAFEGQKFSETWNGWMQFRGGKNSGAASSPAASSSGPAVSAKL